MPGAPVAESGAGLRGRRLRPDMNRGPARAAVWVAVLALGLSVSAHAAGQAVRVELAPGPLGSALVRLAAATQLQLLYDPDLVRDQVAPHVSGVMTPAQALERLLAQTPIDYRFTGDDAVALFLRARRRPAVEPSRSTRVNAAQTVTVVAARMGPGDPGGASSALRVDDSVMTAPVSTASLPRELLQEEQALRLEDVLETVSGIEVAPDGQSATGFSLRGIPTYEYYIDGVRISPDLHHDGYRDVANIERIDIVKGPASMLYGRTEPGGVINVVTKQPTAQPLLSLQQQVGAYGQLRTQFDSGGPLGAAGTLNFRVNAAHERGDSFRGAGNHRVFLAPTLRWRPAQGAEVTAYLEFLQSHDPVDSGLPVVGSAIPAVPITRSVESGGEIRTSDLRVGLRGRFALGPDWSLDYHLDRRWVQTPQRPWLGLADDGLDPATCTLASCPVDRFLLATPHSTGGTWYGSFELHGEQVVWNAPHAVLLGAELFDARSHNVLLYSNTDFLTDLYKPAPSPVPTDLSNPDGIYASTTLERWAGAYLQDRVAIARKLYVLLGVRYDTLLERYDAASGPPLADLGADQLREHAFKRRAGLLWHEANAPYSVYANYVENLGVSTGIYGSGKGGTGQLVPPQSARQWEIGIKAELAPRALAASLSWFDLTKLNLVLPVANPVQNAQGVAVVTSGVRSRGLELDLRAESRAGLRFLASYAYLDTRLLANDANGYAAGNRLFGTPRHGGSLAAYYHPGGVLHGLRLGAGVLARGWREGDNVNDYVLPGFLRCRAMLGYTWGLREGALDLQLKVDNLFDTRYYESVSGTHTVLPGWPRRWMLSVRWEQ